MPSCADNFLDACGNLGLAYGIGLGVAPNHRKAVELLDRGCKYKPEHCRNLAAVMLDGDAAERERAVPMMEKLCDGGELPSCMNLGVLLVNGAIVAKDASRAAGLFERACDGGVAPACSALGNNYLNGDGRQVDHPRGLALELRACDGGFMQGCSRMPGFAVDGRRRAEGRSARGRAAPQGMRRARAGRVQGASSITRASPRRPSPHPSRAEPVARFPDDEPLNQGITSTFTGTGEDSIDTAIQRNAPTRTARPRPA